MRFWTIAGFALLCTTVLAGAGEVAPKFTAKPTAARIADGKVKIEFAVDRETDVAVFIDDAKGNVVRHLVAGVLGKSPPAPLKPGLAQSIEWDGKADYGKPASGGPFKVRVALGVGASYGKVLMRDPQTLQGIKGLAVAPDGTLYVAETVGGSVWRNTTILAFSREGKYLRTVHPFPTSMNTEQVRDLTVFELKGRPAPLITDYRLRLGAIPGFVRKTPMAVTPDGKALVWLSGYVLGMLGTDGSAAGKPGVGNFTDQAHPPDKDGKFRGAPTNWPAMALSSDGKYAYLAGFKPSRYKPEENACVVRVPLATRKGAELFFGDWIKTGKEKNLLGGAPHGLATDGKGKLYIADFSNNRVLIVTEKDGSCAGEIPVDKPHYLAVNPANGNVYVTSWSGKQAFDLVKLSGAGDAKVLVKMPVRWNGNPSYPPLMVLDADADKPIVWLGAEGEGLVRVVDQGNKFESARVSTEKDGAACYLDVSVDRWRPDREIYTRCGVQHDWWYRYNEATGAIDRVVTPGKYVGGIGMGIRAAPDGHTYGLWYPYVMYKHDRSGKPVAWDDPRQPPAGVAWNKKSISLNKTQCYVPNSECALTHGIGVRSDGHIFTLEPAAPGGRPPKFMHEYLPTGKRITTDPIIWKTSDAALGPYFDAAGNIYIAEYVKPKDWPYPPEFASHFGPIKERLGDCPQDTTASMYGSIVKFPPRGGMIHVPVKGGVDSGPDPFDGQPKLDGMKTEEYAYYFSGLMRPIKVTGAEWVHPGISHVGVFACTCENVTLDVDEFGRVWFPDDNLYQVRVIDTNGNRITEFGSYGNADSCGPDSRDKALAEPEIAFAWLGGVAVTDRNIYTGDSINRRMLQLEMTYAAEETCAVK